MRDDMVIDYHDCSFLVDELMAPRLMLGTYEETEIELINKIPDIKNMNVLELGGCLGILSVLVNKKLNNPENHIVVEANPKAIKYLEHNKELNQCKFKIENAMISSRSNGVFFSYDKIVAGSAHRIDNAERNETKHIIEVMTLKELMDKYKILFDLIIVDIEGGELEFFEDVGDIDVSYILVELHENLMYPGFNRRCMDLLESRGMILVDEFAKGCALYKNQKTSKENNDCIR